MQQHLITGDTDHFLPHLIHAINRASHIDITVGFIRITGLQLLESALQDALERKIPMRLLTGDYLNITDVYSLRKLMLLKDRGAKVRIFESEGKYSFHMKAYIFTYDDLDQKGCAFIGSSNISKAALQHGHEWNIRIDSEENPLRFKEIKLKFDKIFAHKQTTELTDTWIDDYEQRIETAPVINIGESGADEELLPAIPNTFQQEALEALELTRNAGYKRGLVVMATGIGKTWLAAFDTQQIKAKRILFVAHREEILDQAEATFLRINPKLTVGRYTGKKKSEISNKDMFFASIQTLGKLKNLNDFEQDYFDYIIVDEFHHAAARSYQKLLNYFTPVFLLGLTATPERTDQADILSLCDNNLVYRRDLFDGIDSDLLCPFNYVGIADEQVDYQEISWRNGKFDPNELFNQLATQSRAKHILKEWKAYKQQRTLAFCISMKHADFMSDFFNQKGYKTVSVHSQSEIRRNEALEQLSAGKIDVVFSVDLFNEGIDLPKIDTVMMLRPTDSKIIFLQQLGRGLRTHYGKLQLIVLDFIGNHISFFRKPEALFGIGSSKAERRDFLKQLQNKTLQLPKGCYVNYDLTSIDFMQSLLKDKLSSQESLYAALKESKGRRPTLLEFYKAKGTIATLRKQYQHWLGFVNSENDLSTDEQQCLQQHGNFFKEVETTSLTKCWKMITLQAMIELDGFIKPPTTERLAEKSYELIQRHSILISDLPENQNNQNLKKWHTYWLSNPINAWIGGNKKTRTVFFKREENHFIFNQTVSLAMQDSFYVFLQELIDYQVLRYEERLNKRISKKDKEVEEAPKKPELQVQRQKADIIPFRKEEGTENTETIEIPYFSDLKIACGHFKSSYQDEDSVELRALSLAGYGRLSPKKHFIARASGNSMNGGKNPIKDGDYLLLELISSDHAGSISNQILAIEQQDVTGDEQFLLRYIKKLGDGKYELIALNPDYQPMIATEQMKTFARFKAVIDADDLY